MKTTSKKLSNTMLAILVLVILAGIYFISFSGSDLQGKLFGGGRYPGFPRFYCNTKFASIVVSNVPSQVTSDVTSDVASIVVSAGGPSQVISQVTSQVSSYVTSLVPECVTK